MMQYLQSVLADMMQWSLACWGAAAFCMFVIGVMVGALLVDAEERC